MREKQAYKEEKTPQNKGFCHNRLNFFTFFLSFFFIIFFLSFCFIPLFAFLFLYPFALSYFFVLLDDDTDDFGADDGGDGADDRVIGSVVVLEGSQENKLQRRRGSGEQNRERRYRSRHLKYMRERKEARVWGEREREWGERESERRGRRR